MDELAWARSGSLPIDELVWARSESWHGIFTLTSQSNYVRPAGDQKISMVVLEMKEPTLRTGVQELIQTNWTSSPNCTI